MDHLRKTRGAAGTREGPNHIAPAFRTATPCSYGRIGRVGVRLGVADGLVLICCKREILMADANLV